MYVFGKVLYNRLLGQVIARYGLLGERFLANAVN